MAQTSSESESSQANRVEINGREHLLEPVSKDQARALRDEPKPEDGWKYTKYYAIAVLRDPEDEVADVLYADGEGRRVVNVEYTACWDSWVTIKRTIWVRTGTPGPNPTPRHLSDLIKTVLCRYTEVFDDYTGPVGAKKQSPQQEV